jgi:hypothetical protein
MIHGIMAGRAGVGYGPHRYWRIKATGWGAIAAFSTVEMYERKFGENKCSGGTASSSTVYDANYPASNAFDGSFFDNSNIGASVWASASEADPWIKYDFGAGNAKSIVAVGLGARNATFVHQTPTAFDIQYSDDNSAWTTAWSVSGLTWVRQEFKRLVNPSWVEPSYSGSPWGAWALWRLQVFGRQGYGNPISLAEIQHRATPGGADQCNGGTPLVNANKSGFTAANGYDNSTSTRWATPDADDWGWIRYTHTAPVVVAQYTINSLDETFFTQSPGAFVFQFWNGACWTTIDYRAGITWARNELKTFTDPAYV